MRDVTQRRYESGRCACSRWGASAERGANQGSVTLIARKPGVGPERLQRWVRQAEIDGDIAR